MSLDLTLNDLEFNFNVTFPGKNKVYKFEDFRLDAGQKLLFQGREQLSLRPKAVETLIALVERNGEVVAKDELMQKVWGDTIVEESNLAQYLHVLRKTLGQMQDGKSFIETLKRRGYRFNGVVVETGADGSERAASLPVNTGASMNFDGRETNGSSFTAWAPNLTVVGQLANVDIAKPPASSVLPRWVLLLLIAVAGTSLLIMLAAFSASRLGSAAASADQAGIARNELTIIPLTNGEIIDQAAISPDGKYFVYTDFDGEISRLWLQQVGEATRVEIIEPSRNRIHDLAFTPDSAAIYFLAWQKGQDSNTLFRVPRSGGLPENILSGVDRPVSFSPNGAEIAFVKHDQRADRSQIIVAASDGTQKRPLLTRQGADVIRTNAAWSPDGRSIAFGVTNQQSILTCSILGIDLETEITKPLSPEEWDSCHRMEWTHDGSGLIFIGTKYKEALTTRRDQIYYLAPGTGEARRLTTDGNWHETMTLGVTNADEILALPFNRVSQIWGMDANGDSRTATQITRGQSDGRGGIDPLPNDKIAFLSRAGDGFAIFQTNSDGSEQRKEIVADPTMEELRVAPDGGYLVFAAKIDGFAHLFRADIDGKTRRQVTFGESTQIDSTISPDGRWIVYASSFLDKGKHRASLQKIRSEGGSPVQLFEGPCYAPHFSPDGGLISCIYGDELRVLSFENGETVNIFKTAMYPLLNNGARWTPDGLNLVYRVSQKNANNLWRQPIFGGEPAPLTDFTAGEIYNFAFASDGLRLYLARGNQIRNAILIRNYK